MAKRVTLLLLVLLLAFSGSGFALTGGFVTKQLDAQKPTSEITDREATDLPNIDPDQEVRVVVEMDGDAPVEVATKKGKKYDKLSNGERKQLEKAAKNKQKAAKDKIKGKKVNIKYEQEFDAIVNGFSGKVKFADIAKIKEVPEVKNVYIATEYELPEEEADMKYSKELVEAQKVWRDFDFKGEGMIVGIIDSGIDPSHKDLVLTDGSAADLSEADVNSAITEFSLPGKFWTEKVPYGWNYMDNNDHIVDLNADTNMHGMHVAGTVAANGDEDNGGIQGVAPEAQLLALRVFGENVATTYGDIYIKAIDDAIKLGADVLNMSLGSTAGFVDANSPEQQAVTRAVENGVIMSISAGNSNYLGSGSNFPYPYASNPDYGVVGSPGVSYDSLQVASFENTNMIVDAVNVQVGEEEPSQVMYLSASQADPVAGTSYELVNAGLGTPEDFAGKDLEGKYALVQRGSIGFVDKAINAQNAGAAGVFIYNNTDGTVSMASDAAITIPQLFMLKADGDRFATALKDGKTVTVSFDGNQMAIPNTNAGKMSDFTSWGITPNLDFKPEITAPGGQIYSTINDDKYAIKSGTSMAAPHVSGGSALVLERVDQEFGLEGADRSKLAKKLMMNTANPVILGEAPVSPRRQGSGLIQLHAAFTTPVTVTDPNTGEAKVALKEVKENVVTFSLTAENLTDKAVSYEVNASAQTDMPVNAGILVSAPNLYGSMDLGEIATVNGQTTSTIEVPANGKTTFEVSVDVSELDADLASIFTNGYWLEGFVKLTDPTDTNPDLVVPYVGFKGDWNAAPIFDAPIWDDATYYGTTGVMSHTSGSSYKYLGVSQETGLIDTNLIAISPNGDGANDSATYLLSLLRNAKEFELNVLDKNGKVVKEIASDEFVRKNYYDGGQGLMYYLQSDWTWDGTGKNGKIVKDGQYFLQAKATLDYEGAEAQTITFPVKLDVTTPKVKTKLGKDGKTVDVDVSDKTSGIAYWDVYVDGEPVTEEPYVNGEAEHVLAEPITKDQTVTVVAVDYAGNVTTNDVKIGSKGNNGTTGNKKN
ncbi:S8 family serine peptidase [Bacillus sp. REN16]|uniref:S8 family serine peptidase n=1 Tax=Bacillus sp. REN16 TaxID=2887296 RepID=UPI001E52FB67|nr:S8 family serine peptidase [Bacillus sp. REN16]MCC3356106.1 S8 family serine peptidase [Bacillus sp. REN16]